ncbi:uncharacterized protein V6R79_000393 [Siganus canaliculatus]
MQERNQDINTVSATVHDRETAATNEAENSRNPNSSCGRINRVRLGIWLVGLPIAQIVIGAVFHNDCPGQRMLPIFLEVLGIFSLSLGVNVLFPKLLREPGRTFLICINFFFLLGWIIAGSVWTFQIFPGGDSICPRAVAISALGFIIIDYNFLIWIIVYNFIYWCCRLNLSRLSICSLTVKLFTTADNGRQESIHQHSLSSSVWYAGQRGPAPVVQCTTVNIHSEPPKDHIVWSLCCFLYSNPFCLGLAALIFSVRSRDRRMLGDLEGARRHASTARCLNIWATVLVSLAIFGCLICIIVIASSVPTYNTP